MNMNLRNSSRQTFHSFMNDSTLDSLFTNSYDHDILTPNNYII